MSALTSAEVNQLENIGTNTISATQWGYLGALDQGLTTSSNVEFNLIIGDGSGLTSLNADYITSGTLPSGRLTGSYTGITGVGALVAGSISSGFGAIDIGSSSLSAGSGTFNGTFLVKDTEPYIEL